MARDDDTNQLSGISIPDECASVHKKSIQVYNTPYSLSRWVHNVYKGGTKPQRLL